MSNRAGKPLGALCLSLAAQAVLAWGGAGHAVVGELAQRRLSPLAAAHVAVALGPGHSLAAVASWADEVRAERPATAAWHYVNIPGAESAYDPRRHCGPVADPQACVVAQLQRLRTDLHCAPTPALRREALLWTVHLVGDIHQPLHAWADGRGGNDLRVVLTGSAPSCGPRCRSASEPMSLHAAWDDGLLERLAPGWGALAAQVEAGWLASSEARAPGLDGGTPVEWANASHALAQQVIRMTPADAVLGEPYFAQAAPLLQRQLGLAGLRLARFLNEAYAATAECPRP